MKTDIFRIIIFASFLHNNFGQIIMPKNIARTYVKAFYSAPSHTHTQARKRTHTNGQT